MLIKFLYRSFPNLLFLFRKLTRVNEEPEMKLLPILCRNDMTSLDVGAKFGMYTYRLRRHSGKVIAFEPIRDLSTALSRIFRTERVDIMALALSATAGQVSMRTPLYKSGNPCYGRSSIEKENRLEFEEIDGWDEFTVETARLDDLSIDNVGFIKIDVEGHEQAVLAGGLATIEKNKPAMLIEANDNHLPKAVEKLFTWADRNNYRLFFMENGRIFPSSSYNIEHYPGHRELENFILVHKDDSERLQQLELAA
ncbi:MAG: FkbM family methyltransferase [Alphaproteobacteria bacterium]|nr:FkbM family methyltransferase [Alphaproteobacteria bacterium]